MHVHNFLIALLYSLGETFARTIRKFSEISGFSIHNSLSNLIIICRSFVVDHFLEKRRQNRNLPRNASNFKGLLPTGLFFTLGMALRCNINYHRSFSMLILFICGSISKSHFNRALRSLFKLSLKIIFLIDEKALFSFSCNIS